jgi:hypothetical protein
MVKIVFIGGLQCLPISHSINFLQEAQLPLEEDKRERCTASNDEQEQKLIVIP